MTMSNGLDRSGLSRDQKVVAAYNTDPLVHDRVSARLGMDIIQSGSWLLSHPMPLYPPILLMHGTLDRIVSPQATQAFAQSLTSNFTFKLWEGFYHELHNEPEKQEVLTFILNWMNNHLD
jgi:alpha-beta hydrolase superfamily lysophospholipase